MTRATVSADGETITVHIPMTFRKRGGRKLVVTPDGAAWAPRPRVDNAMVKALARAFRWRRMLDEGVHATLEDLARAKGVAPSYVSRILRLTLLAPEIVEAILDGRQPAELQLEDLLARFFGLERASSHGPHLTKYRPFVPLRARVSVQLAAGTLSAAGRIRCRSSAVITRAPCRCG